MIDLIYRSKVPGYKGTKPTTAGRTGLLAGLWCYLFGRGAVPAYRTSPIANGATAPTESGCWSTLTGTPQYKTPPVPAPSEPVPEDSPTGETEECGYEPATGGEIHIFPAE